MRAACVAHKTQITDTSDKIDTAPPALRYRVIMDHVYVVVGFVLILMVLVSLHLERGLSAEKRTRATRARA